VGVPEDWEAAAAWYRKGAEKNEPDAEAALGRAYQFGIGVPQNRAVSIYWNERALAHGDLSSEQWVRWLRDPTNNVGFRNPEEQNFVLGNRLRTSGLLLGADPTGILFKDSGERTAWLRGLRKAVDRDEEQSRRRVAEFERQQTENSRRRHESEVQSLQAQGYSREAAENRAAW
jgi:Sec-independent protein translocase protein TatA